MIDTADGAVECSPDDVWALDGCGAGYFDFGVGVTAGVGWPVGNEESSDICIDPSAQVSERRLKTEDDKGCVIGGATGGKQIDQERVGQLLRP